MGNRELSRRELLAGITAAGGSGALVGSSTAAVLSDRESFLDDFVSTGTLDLVVVWEAREDGSGSSEADDSVSLDLDGDGGTIAFSVVLPDDGENNAAYGWFRLTCPGPDVDFADSVDVVLRYEDGARIAEGTLLEVADQLRNGVALYPGGDPTVPVAERDCLEPGETVGLILEYSFDDGPGRGSGDPNERVTFDLDVVGRQCRNRDGTTDPFPAVESCDGPGGKGISFVEIYTTGTDGSCELRGKLELEDDYCGQPGIDEQYIEPGRTYDLYPDADSCDADTGYDVHVTGTETKDGGSETTAIAFEVFAPDGESTELCRVDLKGGAEETTYDDPADFDGNATDGLLDVEGEP